MRRFDFWPTGHTKRAHSGHSTKELSVWRISLAKPPAERDPQDRLIWKEVIVRAKSAARARVIASKLEQGRGQARLGNESCWRSSLLENPRYYKVAKHAGEPDFSEEESDALERVLSSVLIEREESIQASEASSNFCFHQSTHFACDGGGGALGHPKVYYRLKEIPGDSLRCAYCNRLHVYAPEDE